MRASNVTRREWIFVILVVSFVLVLTTIPYFGGYAVGKDGRAFTGILMNPEDSQSYFAKMLQGYDGNWMYQIPFTTEEHAPAFVGGFYLLLGHLARWSGISLVAMWHLARTIASLTMFLTAFSFIVIFAPEPRGRWVAYLLAVFGSGLGWVLFLFDQPYWLDWFPVDFKMPEAHLFFSALTFPHVALGTSLILVSFQLTVFALSGQNRWRYLIAAGGANLALAIVYPFLIYLVAAVLAVYWLMLVWRAHRLLYREALNIAITLVIPLPLVVYYAWTLSTNPVFRAWDAQAITPSPPVPHYLIAYGAMLILVFIALRRWQPKHIFLWAWLIGVALLVYAPLNPQRRFVQGVQVPLAILATIGWQVVWSWLTQTRAVRWIVSHPRYTIAGLERLLTGAFLLTLSVSNVYVLTSVTLTATAQQPYPLFRASDEIAAVDWLRSHTARTDAVLSAYETGNYIAARAGNRVWVGHWAETVAWESKMLTVDKFFDAGTDDAWRGTFLRDQRIVYLFWGPTERKLGAFDPSQLRYLERALVNDSVTIFRVH